MAAPVPSTPPRQPIVAVIDGEIGAGKTTLVNLLVAAFAARGLRAAAVPEPVDEWERLGVLQEFYAAANKPPEYQGLVAYTFQTFTFATRVEATLRAVAENPDADAYILERSVLTDRFVFMELQRELVGPVRMEMYDLWWKMWSRVMPIHPKKVVYLKPTLGNCQTRVQARARKGEVGSAGDEAPARGGVSGAYQARLRRAHEAYLQGRYTEEFSEMPLRPFSVETDVVVVEGPLADDDFSRPGPAADRIVEHVVGRLLE